MKILLALLILYLMGKLIGRHDVGKLIVLLCLLSLLDSI